jgi:hypothetical protein
MIVAVSYYQRRIRKEVSFSDSPYSPVVITKYGDWVVAINFLQIEESGL